MFGLLTRLELKRRFVRRGRCLRAAEADSYLTIGGVLFVVGLAVTPFLASALPPLSIAAGAFLILGGLLTLTVILAPAGLFLL